MGPPMTTLPDMDAPRVKLESRGFKAFQGTQFLGAFNDNFFKFAIIGLIAARYADETERANVEALTQALFALPFVAFATWAGQFADRMPKSWVIVFASALEIAIMLLGVVGFAAGNLPLLIGCVFLMSCQSTYFGPAKYGWMAETIGKQDLTRANGWVGMLIFVAAVGGQLLGAPFYESFGGQVGWASITFVVVAALGLAFALLVPRVPAVEPDRRMVWNPKPELAETWAVVRRDPTLLYTILGTGHFYMLAALLQLILFRYGQTTLELGAFAAGALPTTTVIGVAVGSVLAGRWSENRIELGLVPLGALTMSAAILVLAWLDPVTPTSVGAADWAGLAAAFAPHFGTAFVIGVSGGLFIIPLQAMLQYRSPEDAKGRFLAFGNMIAFVGIFFSAAVLFGLGQVAASVPGFGARGFLAVTGVLSIVGTVVSLKLLPEALIRFVGWLLAHTVYRIRAEGLDRVPRRGGALLVCNHVSWVDAVIVAASCPRRVRFLMYRPYYEWGPVHWFFKLMGCIPVAAGDPPDVLQRSLDRAGEALEAGSVVVIFAEGAITRTGHMLPVRRGFQRIVEGRNVPIIPMHLDGLWGSIFSHEGGRLLWKLPKALPYPVTVSFGEPLPSTAGRSDVRDAIRVLAGDAWELRRETRLPVHLALLRDARRSFGGVLHDDRLSGRSPARLLARALALRDLVGSDFAGKRIGIALPPGLDAATTTAAVLFGGGVPVPLDGDPADQAARAVLIERAGVEAILLRGPESPSPELEGPKAIDLSRLDRGRWRRRTRLWLVVGPLLPFWIMKRLAVRPPGRVSMDAEAVVLQATVADEPVALSHHQLQSALGAVSEALDLGAEDGVCALLPAGDAIGHALGLWLPLLVGAPAALAADPRDVAAVARRLERSRTTVLLAPRRLLHRLARGARPERLGGLRAVIAVDGPPDERLRAEFSEAFGIEPHGALTLPGVGLVTVNTPDVRGFGLFQRGTRPGSLGHPLPGIVIRAGEEGGAGRLGVRGPWLPPRATIELQAPAAQAEADADLVPERSRDTGWVLTDRIGQLDSEGFVFVDDGSGTSPYAALQARLATDLQLPIPSLAVREVDDGPPLVVGEKSVFEAHGLGLGDLEAAWHATSGARARFVFVDELPLTRTGRVDDRALAARVG